ncbi:MAG: portal protein [Pseudomonadota bacterium]
MDGPVTGTAQPGASALAREAAELAEIDYQADRQNRQEALVDLEFLAGRQWNEEDRQARERAKRPVLQINRLIQPVKQTMNDIRSAVPQVKVSGVSEGSDEDTAAVFGGIARQIQRDSLANWIYAVATGHAATCGIGHFRVNTDYESEDGFEQAISLELIANPLAVLWDAAAKKPDRSDAKRVFVFEQLQKRDFEKRYPGRRIAEFSKPDQRPSNQRTLTWATEDTVTIAEYWRLVEVEKEIALLRDGSVVDVEQLQHLPIDEANIVQRRKSIGHEVVQTIINGVEVLEEEKNWPSKFLPIIPVIGMEVPVDDDTERFGMVRHARDPQRMYNYWRSSSAEWINQGAKTPWLATEKQIANHKKMWEEANTNPRPYLLFDIDETNPQVAPRRMEPPSPPQAFWQEGSVTADEIKATTGIYDAALGAGGNETSGRAILARQQESDNANYEYGDNLKLSLTHLGRVLVDMIPRVYDSRRIIRILDDEAKQALVEINLFAGYGKDGEKQFVHDLSAGKYDLDISIGPSHSTRRRETAEAMLEIFKYNQSLFAVAGDLLVEQMDWPEKDKLVERIRRAMPPDLLGDKAPEDKQQPPQPSPEEQAAMKLELQEKATNIEKTVADTELARAKAQREQVGAVMDQIPDTQQPTGQ